MEEKTIIKNDEPRKSMAIACNFPIDTPMHLIMAWVDMKEKEHSLKQYGALLLRKQKDKIKILLRLK